MSTASKLKKKAAEFELKKQYDKAIGLYVQVLEETREALDDADIPLFNRVGDLLLRTGSTADALTYYEKAVDVYAERGFLNNAIALCNKILRQSPGRTAIYYKLGKISAHKGFKGDAKKNFLEYADRVRREGHVDEAFRALKEFADLCPDQDDVRLMLAEQFARDGRKDEAIEQLQLLYDRFVSEGRTTEAHAAVERMRTINPSAAPREAAVATPTKPSDLVFLDLDDAAEAAPGGLPPVERARAPEIEPPEPPPQTRSPVRPAAAPASSRRPTPPAPELDDDERIALNEAFDALGGTGAAGDAADDVHESDRGTVDAVDRMPVGADSSSMPELVFLDATPDVGATAEEQIDADRAESVTPVHGGSAPDELPLLAELRIDDAAAPPIDSAGMSSTAGDLNDPLASLAPAIARPSAPDLVPIDLGELEIGDLDLSGSSHATDRDANGSRADLDPLPDAIDLEVAPVDGGEGAPLDDELDVAAFVGWDSDAADEASAAPPHEAELPTAFDSTTPPVSAGADADMDAPAVATQSSSGAEPEHVAFAVSQNPPAGVAADAEDSPAAGALPSPEGSEPGTSGSTDEKVQLDIAEPAALADPAAVEVARGGAEARAELHIVASGDVVDAPEPGEPLGASDRADAPAGATAAEGPVGEWAPIAPGVEWLDVPPGVDPSMDVRGEEATTAVPSAPAADDLDLDSVLDGAEAMLPNAEPDFGGLETGSEGVAPAFAENGSSEPDAERPMELETVSDAANAPEPGAPGTEASPADASSASRVSSATPAVTGRGAETSSPENPGFEDLAHDALARGPSASEPEARAVESPASAGTEARATTRETGGDAASDELLILRSRLGEEPENWALRQEYAEALLEVGERATGFGELERAMLGLEAARDLVGAKAIADELVRLFPGSVRHHQKRVEYAVRAASSSALVEAYLDLADALFRGGEFDKALAVYRRVIELAPSDRRAATALAALDGDTGRPAASAVVPDAAATPAGVSWAVDGGVDHAAATSQHDAAPRGNGSAEGVSAEYINLGDWLRGEEPPRSTRMVVDAPAPTGDEDADFAEMLRRFKQSVAENVDDEDYDSHYDLGIAYKEMGLLDEAVAEFQRALRGTTQPVRAYEALGQCFVEQARFQLAQTVLTRALSATPDSDQQLVGVLYLLGYASEALGRRAEALEYYNRVVAVDIRFRDVAVRMAAVERMNS